MLFFNLPKISSGDFFLNIRSADRDRVLLLRRGGGDRDDRECFDFFSDFFLSLDRFLERRGDRSREERFELFFGERDERFLDLPFLASFSLDRRFFFLLDSSLDSSIFSSFTSVFDSGASRKSSSMLSTSISSAILSFLKITRKSG